MCAMDLHDVSFPTFYIALLSFYRNEHFQSISCGHFAAVVSQLRHFALSAWSPVEVLCVKVASFCNIFNFHCKFSLNVLLAIVFVLVFVPVILLVYDGVLQVLQVYSPRQYNGIDVILSAALSRRAQNPFDSSVWQLRHHSVSDFGSGSSVVVNGRVGKVVRKDIRKETQVVNDHDIEEYMSIISFAIHLILLILVVPTAMTLNESRIH